MIKDIGLHSIDYEESLLALAKHIAEQKFLANFIHLSKNDAWNLNIDNQFDLISSNGLSIYEPSQERCGDLYQQFYQALKKGCKLVMSYLSEKPEWDMIKIQPEHLLLQKIIFVDIIKVKFYRRSGAVLEKYLKSLRFRDISFIYDQAKIFFQQLWPINKSLGFLFCNAVNYANSENFLYYGHIAG